MAATPIIKSPFHQSIAKAIYDSVRSRTDLYYYFMGRVIDWGDDAIDLRYKASQFHENELRNSLFFSKLIETNDISLVIERRDWKSGEIYDMFDDNVDLDSPTTSGATSLSVAKFYVLNSEFNIYKCIYNAGGAASTIEPTGSSTDYINTGDGYVWKFMGFMPLVLRNKFLTPSKMPVTRAVDNQYYSNGGISAYTIVNGGSGYNEGTTTATVTGDGTGALVDVVLTLGQVTDLIIVDPGQGYTTASITISDSDLAPGSGAEVTVSFSVGDLDTFQANTELLAIAGSLSYIVVEDSGANYTSATVTIDGDGTGATATATIAGGLITGINITNFGSGYTYATATITGDGSGAIARVIIAPRNGHGYNMLEELYAETVCFYSSIGVEKHHGLDITNTIKQIGIVKNPLVYGGTNRYINSFGTYCHLLEGTINAANYAVNEIISTVGGKRARVIEVTTNKMVVVGLDGADPVVSDVYRNAAETDSFTVTSVTEPDLSTKAGSILYVDNQRTTFVPSAEQSVAFRSFVKV